MRFLDEFRRRPAVLADHLPWAALVAPGVILNKDGSFTAGFRFRGPDLESSTEEELLAVRARLNNALKRLASGWCLHVQAVRRRADAYPEQAFPCEAAELVDAERRALFGRAEPAFETDHFAAATWLPPADQTRWIERWLLEGLGRDAAGWRDSLSAFGREVESLIDLLADVLPECERLTDAELLSWLHACVSPDAQPIAPPDTPMFLDAWLADAPLTGGLAPTLAGHALRVVSVRGLPSATRPGLLDALANLPFAYRWTTRWIALSKTDAEGEIVRLRKRWFAKRKGVGVLLREAITKEEVPLLDTDAAAKTLECDVALEALGGEVCAFGHFTLTVSLLDPDPDLADRKARLVCAALNAQGLVARVEDLNAVEAWLGAAPGEAYADVRRPIVSTLNLADLLPAAAVWAGPAQDPVLGAPLAIARTTGATPFRLALHVGDVGHAMIVGPTGAGKSALLAFLALQWLRYRDARVVFLDKGRSARAATLAARGSWRALEAESALPLQPLAQIDREIDRAWAADWLADLLDAAGGPATPTQREEIWSALTRLAEAPPEQRTLTVFSALVQDRAVGQALEPFTLRGPHGALLDGAEDALEPSRFDTFELETLMATPSALAPTLAASSGGWSATSTGAPPCWCSMKPGCSWARRGSPPRSASG